MRALIYARYSTELQSSLSIEDQFRVCTDLVARNGWAIAGQHCDAAISGAVRDRPGLNAMLEAIAAGIGDVIVAESLDRISRDLEDIASIHKRVLYAGGRIVTLSEGEVGPLHIGLRGTMAAMQRQDIADKVKRGLTGRALAGSNPGGMAYGYRKIAKLDERGEAVRGLREIDPEQAIVIRRIFDDFALGVGARQLAARLNAEGVEGPTGGRWRPSSITGDPKRLNGILRNPLYVGQLIYNRTRRVRNPETRKREIRVNVETEWISVDVPHLRIVSDAQWQAVEKARRRYASPVASARRRPKRLLSGKARCGLCGGRWIVVGNDRWGCGNHRDALGCANGRTITTGPFERRVLSGLANQLLAPELVDEYVRDWRAARAERLSGASRERDRLARQHAEAERKVGRLITALTDERLSDIDELRSALAKASADRNRLGAALEDFDDARVIVLHPNLAADYRARVGAMVEGSADPGQERSVETINAIRSLIDAIVVLPNPEGRGITIEVRGTLTAILGGAADQDAPNPATAKIVC